MNVKMNSTSAKTNTNKNNKTDDDDGCCKKMMMPNSQSWIRGNGGLLLDSLELKPRTTNDKGRKKNDEK